MLNGFNKTSHEKDMVDKEGNNAILGHFLDSKNGLDTAKPALE